MPTREPSVAGTFYPSDAREIRAFAEPLLISKAFPLSVRAVILPHAGYIYSGETACRVLSRIHVPDKIFLIGPNHRAVGSDFALFTQGEWQTPLGRVPIDSEMASRLLEMSHDLAHDEEAHRVEHSLEVELPLLQIKNPVIKIIPLIVGTLNLEAAREVALACGQCLPTQGEPLLVVVSNDMSHYESDEATRRKDQYALRAIENLDEEALVKAVVQYNITMCGFVPVYMLLVMKDLLGIRKATLIDYRTSADSTGDKDRVVGYAGFIFE